MSVAQQITEKITRKYAPELLEVIDESAKHHGHSGARPEGETHFHVQMVSHAFEKVSRIGRHRLIHELLAEELKHPVHALSLSLMTPEEYAAR
jgi:BolA protein